MSDSSAEYDGPKPTAGEETTPTRTLGPSLSRVLTHGDEIMAREQQELYNHLTRTPRELMRPARFLERTQIMNRPARSAGDAPASGAEDVRLLRGGDIWYRKGQQW
jgi:hypothetical protein